MPKTIVKRYKVYQFDELDERAKDKARDWYREGALDYDWWDSLYMDAERIGLKITGFDLDRRRSAEGSLTEPFPKVCQAILKEHGKNCDTYKLAQSTLEEYQALLVQWRLNDERDELDELDCSDPYLECQSEFAKALLEEYSLLLQHEYEYLLSDEAVDESIQANEYTFLKDGTRQS